MKRGRVAKPAHREKERMNAALRPLTKSMVLCFLATLFSAPAQSMGEGRSMQARSSKEPEQRSMPMPRYAISLAVSPDGNSLLHGSTRGGLHERDAKTNKIEKAFRGHTDDVMSAVYSPDGRHILSGSLDRTARLWDAATGNEVITLKEHSDTIRAVAYSPCGSYLAIACGDGMVSVWDARRHRLLHDLDGDVGGKAAMSIAFSPCGSSLIIGFQTGKVRLLDTESGVLLWEHEAHKHWVSSVAFGPGGQHVVSASTDGTAKVCTASEGKLLTHFKKHGTDTVKWVQFLSDAKLVLSIGSGGGRIWEYDTGKQVRRTGPIGDSVNGAAVLDKRGILVVGTSREISLWDLKTGERCCLKHFPELPQW